VFWPCRQQRLRRIAVRLGRGGSRIVELQLGLRLFGQLWIDRPRRELQLVRCLHGWIVRLRRLELWRGAFVVQLRGLLELQLGRQGRLELLELLQLRWSHRIELRLWILRLELGWL
jgi:hypothetical protein